jgi:hypothetical protein
VDCINIRRRTETSAEVVANRPNGRLEFQGRPDGSNAPHERDSSDEVDIEPIDMLVPVVQGDGGVCNVWLWLGTRPPRRGSGL